MLSAVGAKKSNITKIERRDDRLYLYSEAGTHRLEPKDERTVRVTYTIAETFSDAEKPGVVFKEVYGGWTYAETEKTVRVMLGKLTLEINKETGSIRYLDGKDCLLLKERDFDSKTMEAFTAYRTLEEGASVETIQTPDGAKKVVRDGAKVSLGTYYHTRLYLDWAEEEALYGLGQQEEGLGSLRGQTVYLHQANRKIAVPVLVSTKGYGFLMDTYSPMIFQDNAFGSYFYTEADLEMDFYFWNGIQETDQIETAQDGFGTEQGLKTVSGLDGVIKGYRKLTGDAVMLPKWAFGYIQSQERYETQKEILQVAQEYRKRNLGLDGIVLDWCSWQGNEWGQKTFDPERFPNPREMVEKLHEGHTHFMLSIWPNMGEETANYLEMKAEGCLLPNCNIYNALSQKGADLYWKQVKAGLYPHGIDAWWCDNSEPFTPEWNHPERVEPSKMYSEYCETVVNHLPPEQMNAYGLYHAKTIYEGQRREDRSKECSKETQAQKAGKRGNTAKRVFNLTRSGYTGSQRYGTVLWSGDIEATWATLKRQIAASLHFCASGLPYWTVDIGAFFVKRGNLWFWKGDYDEGPLDAGYRELFVRWYQWGCFLPIFRGHGTDFYRELWRFGEEKDVFYEALKKMNHLRYELLPYIYSVAGNVWKNQGLMIKPLAFAYPADKCTHAITDQYLFGDALMICPVTSPMYYAKHSMELAGTIKTRKVYLPAENDWYDFWTNAFYEGGQWIDATASLDTIPVFVKAGSILPRQAFALSTEEAHTDPVFWIYGEEAAGAFGLYEDAGDGYGYETGEYCLRKLRWNAAQKRLIVEATEGNMQPIIRDEFQVCVV